MDVAAQDFTEVTIRHLQSSGILRKDLTGEEHEYLSYARHVVDEVAAGMGRYLSGEYSQPGEAFHSLELYGLYQCFYAYEDGVLLFDALGGSDLDAIPLLRLYINRQLVGLSLFGTVVMDYYSDYLRWVESHKGFNFTFF